MSTLYIQNGSVLDVILTGTVSSNDVFDFGSMIGVVLVNGVSGDTVAVQVDGVWELPADNSITFTQGDRLFWTGTELNKTAASNTPAGFAAADKTMTATVARIKLIHLDLAI